MNRFLCGFDDYDAAHLLSEFATVTSSPTIVSGRTGSCLRCANGHSVYVTAAPEGDASICVNVAVRFSTLPATPGNFIVIGDNTNTHVTLAVNSSGTLAVYRSNQSVISGNSPFANINTLLGTGTIALLANVWYWIGLKVTIHDSTGTVDVQVNGAVDTPLTLTGKDTRNGGTATAVIVGIGQNVSLTSVDFDDFVVNDTSGSTNNDLIADSRVDFHLPNANGSNTAWTRSTGADDYAVIDENPPTDDTDYLSTSTLNAITTVNIQDFKNSGATIAAVQVNLLTRKIDAGTCGLAPVIRIDSTDNVGTQVNPSTTYAYQRQNYDVQPDTTAWNETDFNAM